MRTHRIIRRPPQRNARYATWPAPACAPACCPGGRQTPRAGARRRTQRAEAHGPQQGQGARGMRRQCDSCPCCVNAKHGSRHAYGTAPPAFTLLGSQPCTGTQCSQCALRQLPGHLPPCTRPCGGACSCGRRGGSARARPPGRAPRWSRAASGRPAIQGAVDIAAASSARDGSVAEKRRTSLLVGPATRGIDATDSQATRWVQGSLGRPGVFTPAAR